MEKQNNIAEILNKAGKKDNLYYFYYISIFLLFGSLGVFDIVTSLYSKSFTSTVIFNLTIGIVFSLISLCFLFLLISFIIKPKTILNIDLLNKKVVFYKPFNKKSEIPFENIYFLKDGGENIISFIFKYSTIKIFTHLGETFVVKNISNSRVIKTSLDMFLNLTSRTIYKPNPVKLFFIRIYQSFLNLCLYFVPHKEPKLLQSKPDIVKILKSKQFTRVLVLTGRNIAKKGLVDPYITLLKEQQIEPFLYNEIDNNPTITNCKKAKEFYLENKCEAIIAIGGGSIIDAAKAIATIVSTKKNLIKYKGLFKIHHNVPLIFAIPTTCGTGSETTFISVIRDDAKNEKFEIISNKITPSYAYLDEELLKSLPLHFIGSTSMDALTHALESYLNNSRTKKSKKQSLEAIKIIYENLDKVHDNESDLTLRKNLLYASYLAGKSFNRGLVGPIHALAHALGGKYNLEHGYLNAILMPRFLRVYLFYNYKELGEVSRYINLSKTDNINYDAKQLINYISKINGLYNFIDYIDVLKTDDVHLLAKKAYKEAHLLYPSKHFVTINMYEDILVSLLKK